MTSERAVEAGKHRTRPYSGGHNPQPDGMCEHRWANRVRRTVHCGYAEGYAAALAATPTPREDGWEELRREIEALPFDAFRLEHQPAAWVINRAAVLAIVDRLAAARGEPELDVERLARALTAMWPHHTEGIGSSPPSSGDHSYEVWEPFLLGSPDSVAAALAAEYAALATPTTPEPDPER